MSRKGGSAGPSSSVQSERKSNQHKLRKGYDELTRRRQVFMFPHFELIDKMLRQALGSNRVWQLEPRLPSYLIKCNMGGREDTVYGYKGKQVSDNIHSHDVAQFMIEFARAPRVAEVYNLGGGRKNSCSIHEAFEMARNHTGKTMKWRYVEENRSGDHICYAIYVR